MLWASFISLRDVDSVAHLETFRALKLTVLESFRALILLKPYWRFLGPYPIKTHMESFRALILTLLESFRALRLRIVTNCLPNPCMGALRLRMVTTCLPNPCGGPYG